MYKMDIEAGVSGTPQLEQLNSVAGKLTNTTKGYNDALYGQTKASEAATLAQIKLATEETKLEQIRERHRMLLESLAAASHKAAAGQDALSAGNQRVVGSSMAATSALRVMEGAMPIRSAAAFLGSIQGLGPALQMAFPLVGAIALVGVFEKIVDHVDKWYDKYVLLKQVQDEIARTAKELASSTEQSYFNVNRMAIASLRKKGNFAEAGRIEASDAASTPISLPTPSKDKLEALQPGQIASLQRLYGEVVPADLARRRSAIQDRLHTLRLDSEDIARGGVAVGPLTGASAQQLSKEKDFLDGLLDAIQARHTEFVRTLQAIREKTQDEIDAPGKAARSQSSQSLRQLRKAEQTPTAAFLEKYSALLPADRAASAPEMQARLRQIANKEFLAYVERQIHGGPGTGYDSAFHPEGKTPHKLTLTGFDDSEDANEQYKNQKEAVRVYESAELGRVNTQAGSIRDMGNRRARLAAAGADPGNELATLRQQIAIRREAAQQEFDLKRAHSDILDIDKARLEYVREIGDLDLDYQTKILEMKRKQKQEFQSEAVGFFNAAKSGGLSRFLLGQVNNLEDKVVSNAAGMVWPTVQKALSGAHIGQAGTTMGKLLEGTPFGPDPMKTAGVTLTEAGDKLIAAAADLSAATGAGGAGGAGGGSASGGYGSSSSVSTFARLAGLGAAIAGPSYSGLSGLTAGLSHTGDLRGIFTGDSKMAGGGWQSLSGSERAGAAIGTGAAVIGGGMAAYSGFKRGGAQGALQGVSAITGTAAMLDPEPISKAILMGVAVGSGLLATVLGDPHAKRVAQIANDLKTSQYMAPVSMNASMTGSGGYADYDRFGGVRGSSLSPFPSVEQGFFDYRRNVTVPGRTNSQFGGGGGTTVVISPGAIAVNTIDSRSFNENSHLVAGAVQHAIQTGHATGLQETLRAM